MNLTWNIVEPSDHDWINESIKCLATVSKNTADSFTLNKMQLRMTEKKMVPTIRPRTESMFEVWIALDDDNENAICMALFLDRTLDRPDPHSVDSVPRKDIWCVTVGVAERYKEESVTALYNEIKEFLKSNEFPSPKERRWGVVWDAGVTMYDESNVGDLIFRTLESDVRSPGSRTFAINADKTPILSEDNGAGQFPSDVKSEPAYNHFKESGMTNLKMAIIYF